MQPLKPLAEQTIVLTGASSGIGRATALMAARRGARVVLAARDATALQALEAEIRRCGGRALAVPADVADEAHVQRLAECAVERFGGIDTWVNNAAVSTYGAFEQLPPAEFRQVVEVTFFGQVHGARAALPYLKQQGRGALICIGSALSDRAVQQQSPYCAAKHAVKALTESLRLELRESGSTVQVTLIKPSSIDTPLFDHAATHMGVKPKPIAPIYAPELVAKAVLYAAEHRTRELVVGGGGKLLATLEAFAGPLLDWYMVRTGSTGQQSAEPKPAGAPSNLFAPFPGADHVRGGFQGRGRSVYTTARLHPRLAGSVLSIAAALCAFRLRAAGREGR